MRKANRYFLVVECFLLTVCFSGCWNYREIEKFSIVAGIAIDFNKDMGKYIVTTEIIDFKSGGKEIQTGSSIMVSEGASIFDAIRNSIPLTGEKLYFSHAKTLIISKEIAKEGILPVLDFMNRHNETRYDMDIMISDGKASEILKKKTEISSEILSYKISDALMNSEKNMPSSNKDIWQFINEVAAEDLTATLPIITTSIMNDKSILIVNGTGIFKGDKLSGSINKEETGILLLIKDKIQGGLFVIHDIYKEKSKNVTFEISKNKTKVVPVYTENQLVMKISIETEVVLGENLGQMEFKDEEEFKKLKEISEKEIERRVERLIKKVQKENSSDIFGFGKEVRVHLPNIWDQYKDNWESVFSSVAVEVNVNILIKNTGVEAKSNKVGL